MDRIPAASEPAKGILTLTVLACILAVIQRFFRTEHDPREPPVIPSKLPILGHAIGMLKHGKQYIRMLDQKYGYEIYTLGVPKAKLYVITSPAMAAAANRQGKNVAFRPFILDFVKNLTQLDDYSHNINKKNLYDEEGKGLLSDNHDVLYKTMSSGPALDEICQATMDGFAKNLNALDRKETTIHLKQFVRGTVGILSTRALWGPENFLEKDPALLNAFWDVEAAQPLLGIGILPSIFARRGYLGRAKLQAAMERYFEQGHWRTASTVVRERAITHFAHGYKPKMMARADMSLLLGTVPNTTRALFWFLSYSFAHPELVAEMRAELSRSDAVSRAADGKTAVVDIHTMRSSCPLYNATLREILRLMNQVSSVRTVREDVVLGDRYLLRKGALCLIEAGVLHTKQSVWGDDALTFNPRRFLKHQSGEITDGSGRKVHQAALRIWGGGEVICPGRFFASVEILGIAAPLIMGWSVEGGVVKVPRPKDDVMPVGVYDPSEDMHVKLIGREEWKDVVWKYKV